MSRDFNRRLRLTNYFMSLQDAIREITESFTGTVLITRNGQRCLIHDQDMSGQKDLNDLKAGRGYKYRACLNTLPGAGMLFYIRCKTLEESLRKVLSLQCLLRDDRYKLQGQ